MLGFQLKINFDDSVPHETLPKSQPFESHDAIVTVTWGCQQFC